MNKTQNTFLVSQINPMISNQKQKTIGEFCLGKVHVQAKLQITMIK